VARKKRTIPYSKLNVQRAVEEQLDDLTVMVRKHEKDRKSVSFQYFNDLRTGTFRMAQKLGFDCRCALESDPITRRPSDLAIPACWCVDTKRGIDPGHQILETAKKGSYHFDGTNCRDKAGAFVPIARCNPPWARKRRRASSG
jgi:hypothetical protein